MIYSQTSAEADMKVVQRLKKNPASQTDFEQLYERYAPATFAFFIRKVGDPTTAADLNQDLYLRLSRSIAKFEGRCSWRTSHGPATGSLRHAACRHFHRRLACGGRGGDRRRRLRQKMTRWRSSPPSGSSPAS
jgi:hypothetical protein